MWPVCVVCVVRLVLKAGLDTPGLEVFLGQQDFLAHLEELVCRDLEDLRAKQVATFYATFDFLSVMLFSAIHAFVASSCRR